MSQEYEQFVMRWIAREYEAQGYRVQFGSAVPTSDIRFDALAERESDGAKVLIELIDARHAGRKIEERVRALERFAEEFPNARVDLRRLDYEMPSWLMRIADRPGERKWSLRQLVSDDFWPVWLSWPAPIMSGVSAESYLTGLWTLHAAMLRAFSEELHPDGSDARSVLALYNDLLASGRLKAPEDESENVSLDLFQLFDAVVAVMNGASARDEEASQLYGHLISVRQQIIDQMGRPER